MKIVFADSVRLPDDSLAVIKNFGNVEFYDSMPQTLKELIDRVSGFEIAVISNGNFRLSAEFFEATSGSLKYVIKSGVAVDSVDLEQASKYGVKVLNSPTYNIQAVSEFVLSSLFALSRQLIAANESIKSEKWEQTKFKGVEISGKNLVLVGYGNIGKTVESLVSGFNLNVQHINSKTKSIEADELLKLADFVVLCCSLNESTKHFIDERRFGILKPTVLLVNVARGAVIDQTSLIKALKSNKIGGAALDVFTNEPYDDNSFNDEVKELVSFSNVLATPHIAYNTQESMARRGQEMLANLESCIAGKPINTVN